MQLLEKKVVIITGASSGLGRATALECALHGARLVLHHIEGSDAEQDIETLKQEISELNTGLVVKAETTQVAVDVTHPEAGRSIVDAALSAYDEVNAIVHNAGICRFEDFTSVTPELRDRTMAVNYGGPFTITQAVVEQMIAQGRGGSVVCIASITAKLGSSQLTHYSPTKAALLGMTVSCAVAFGKHGIRFNAVSPGTIETTMNREDLAGPKRERMVEAVPLGRLGKPEDIAKPVVFFISDLARYISGQNLIVDGGASVYYQ